eukprot:1699185-Alexandrium_andersonii.AAC.1
MHCNSAISLPQRLSAQQAGSCPQALYPPNSAPHDLAEDESVAGNTATEAAKVVPLRGIERSSINHVRSEPGGVVLQFKLLLARGQEGLQLLQATRPLPERNERAIARRAWLTRSR